ncbi:hypothetical protein [Streptomyces sp. E5N91]|uniref:hypothetical protein n=1 Tax=Streptomyces sp. E5N91 TaxID=1851996 RepID=UPI000EF57FEA|nr:hypothetical protein [Streptomyces sp. E5N91]
MTAKRYTASDITDDALDALYANATEGWRRGDRWKERALAAEAAIERAEQLAARWKTARPGHPHHGFAVVLLEALAQPEETSTK